MVAAIGFVQYPQRHSLLCEIPFAVGLALSADNLTLSILIILTVAIYVVILVMFIIARRKYKGGVVDRVIRYVIATIGLLLLADVTLILVLAFGLPWGYSAHIILKILAMTCLTKGGLELFARQP